VWWKESDFAERGTMSGGPPAAMKICFRPNEPGKLLETKGRLFDNPSIFVRTRQVVENTEVMAG
jgi:hypothetical protein